jgi:hypothetical protein
MIRSSEFHRIPVFTELVGSEVHTRCCVTEKQLSIVPSRIIEMLSNLNSLRTQPMANTHAITSVTQPAFRCQLWKKVCKAA